MDKLIVGLFGVNRINLLGWLVAGLLLLGLAFYLVIAAVQPLMGKAIPPEILLLTAICLLLTGIFGVLLQLYCSLLAVKLDLKAGPTSNEEKSASTNREHE